MIATIEDAILEDVRSALGNTLREVATLPGGWTMDMLTRALQFAPGVYIGFTGLTPTNRRGCYNARFGLYVVTKGAREPQRRQGNPREIGAYDLIMILLNRLALLTIEDIGRVQVISVENLFRDALFDIGGTVYGITLEVANLMIDGSNDLPGAITMADFITFDYRYNLNSTSAGSPIAGDTVTLQINDETEEH